jgi:hypothetical protein
MVSRVQPQANPWERREDPLSSPRRGRQIMLASVAREAGWLGVAMGSPGFASLHLGLHSPACWRRLNPASDLCRNYRPALPGPSLVLDRRSQDLPSFNDH